MVLRHLHLSIIYTTVWNKEQATMTRPMTTRPMMTRPMMKSVIAGMLTLFFVMGSLSVALAEPEGNKRKGKYTYRKVYKACMARGEVDSPKPVVNPDTKTQAQWQEVFENKNFADFQCQEEWAALSDTELTDIYAYLHSGAADSPTPAKCK